MKAWNIPLLPIFVCLFLCCLFFALSCGDDDDDNNDVADDDSAIDDDDTVSPDDDSNAHPSFCEVDEEFINDLMARMSLKRKIAQMYMVGVQVLPWFDYGDAQRFVEEIGVGCVGVTPGTGVGFWPEWTVTNTNKLQAWALAGDPGIPLFIAADQEGGVPAAVNNLTGGTDQPGNMGLGATFDPEATYDSYRIMGEQLFALGINNPYSPVVEIAAQYTDVPMYMRAFGEDTQLVAEHAAQAVRAFQDQLVVATAKHFPGQGQGHGDTHAGMVVNNDSEELIREKYLPPFQAAIDAGVDMIMTIHEIYTNLDPGVPATFSEKIITEILRGEMGYEGLIISDDINMGAIMAEPLDEHPDVTAIAAGVDLVLDAGGDAAPGFGIDPANLQWAWKVADQIDTVIEAIDGGRLTEERIDESVRRILRTKMKYCFFEIGQRDSAAASASLQTRRQIEDSERLFEKSITLLKNDDSILPLDPEAGLKIHVLSAGRLQSEMYPDAFWGNVSSTSLFWEIKNLYHEATGDHFDVDPNQRVINRLVRRTESVDPDVLIIGSFNGYYYEGQTELINALLDLGIPTVMAAMASPYDIIGFDDVKAYLAVYSNRPLPLKVAADIIFGTRTPKGRLPVTISEDYDMGYGLTKDISLFGRQETAIKPPINHRIVDMSSSFHD